MLFPGVKARVSQYPPTSDTRASQFRKRKRLGAERQAQCVARAVYRWSVHPLKAATRGKRDGFCRRGPSEKKAVLTNQKTSFGVDPAQYLACGTQHNLFFAEQRTKNGVPPGMDGFERIKVAARFESVRKSGRDSAHHQSVDTILRGPGFRFGNQKHPRPIVFNEGVELAVGRFGKRNVQRLKAPAQRYGK